MMTVMMTVNDRAQPPLAFLQLGLHRPRTGVPNACQHRRRAGRAFCAGRGGGSSLHMLQNGDVIAGRYELREALGEQSASQTFVAHDRESGDDVLIKALALQRLKTWKALELFEREAKILAALNNPAIPKYLNYFEEDSDADRVYFLVQQRAPGRSLGELVRSGWRAEPSQVRSILVQLLRVAEYLESLSPPVVHRDIKPDNIIIGGLSGDGTGADSAAAPADVRVSVVDFGAVVENATVLESRVGDTMIGTFGYMAPEQFGGVASIATDLYSIGATMLYVLTGRDPGTLPQKRLRIDFRGALLPMSESAEMRGVVELVQRLTQPAPEDRPSSAARALKILEDGEDVRSSGDAVEALSVRRASNSLAEAPSGALSDKIDRELQDGRLIFRLLPSKLGGDTVASLGFTTVWCGVTSSFTIGALTAGAFPALLFSLPFWWVGGQLAYNTVRGVAEASTVTVDSISGVLSVRTTLLRSENTVAIDLKTLVDVKVVDIGDVNGNALYALQLSDTRCSQRVAEGRPLSDLQYIASEILDFVRDNGLSPRLLPTPKDRWTQLPMRRTKQRWAETRGDWFD